MDSSPFIYFIGSLMKELVPNDQWKLQFSFTRSISKNASLLTFKDSVHLLWIVFSNALKYKIKITWDFPGGAVAKSTLPVQGPGFNPLVRELGPRAKTKT